VKEKSKRLTYRTGCQDSLAMSALIEVKQIFLLPRKYLLPSQTFPQEKGRKVKEKKMKKEREKKVAS
jgi:hypothetical protein